MASVWYLIFRMLTSAAATVVFFPLPSERTWRDWAQHLTVSVFLAVILVSLEEIRDAVKEINKR